MNTGKSAFKYFHRPQLRQSAQPKASGLDFAMTKLPGLYGLIWPPNPAGYDGDRIFNRYASDRCVHKKPDKLQGLTLFSLLVFEPAPAADGQVGTRRVGYHQVPAVIKDIPNIPLIVWPRAFSRQQISGKRLMPLGNECVSNNAAKFTGNKNPHFPNPVSERAGLQLRWTAGEIERIPEARHEFTGALV